MIDKGDDHIASPTQVPWGLSTQGWDILTPFSHDRSLYTAHYGTCQASEARLETGESK